MVHELADTLLGYYLREVGGKGCGQLVSITLLDLVSTVPVSINRYRSSRRKDAELELAIQELMRPRLQLTKVAIEQGYATVAPSALVHGTSTSLGAIDNLITLHEAA